MVVLPTDRERMLRHLRDLDERIRAAAAARAGLEGTGRDPYPSPIAAKIAEAEAARIANRTQELFARPAESQAAYIASILNRGGSNASDFADAGNFDSYEAIRRAMGQNVNPATVRPEDLYARVGDIKRDDHYSVGRYPAPDIMEQLGLTDVLPKESLYRSMAQLEGRGMKERIGMQELRLNQALAGSRGARAGLYGAVGAGSAMGLTAAGQGVVALMEYMQSGMEQAEQREATPLA